MADLATLTARLDALLDVRASGTLTVEIEGQRISYRSDPELAAAIADIERRIAAAQGRRITDIRLRTSKGLTR
jgi:hypothetical protein